MFDSINTTLYIFLYINCLLLIFHQVQIVHVYPDRGQVQQYTNIKKIYTDEEIQSIIIKIHKYTG
jgi:hypothetical protein